MSIIFSVSSSDKLTNFWIPHRLNALHSSSIAKLLILSTYVLKKEENALAITELNTHVNKPTAGHCVTASPHFEIIHE